MILGKISLNFFCTLNFSPPSPRSFQNVTLFSVILQIALSFSEEQRKKIRNRNRYKSKKDQNSSNIGETSKEVSIDDSLLDEDVHNGSQRSSPQKSKSLEDKLDRFFTEFENFSHRLKSLEDKNTETVSSRTSSDRDSLHVASNLWCIINLYWLVLPLPLRRLLDWREGRLLSPEQKLINSPVQVGCLMNPT